MFEYMIETVFGQIMSTAELNEIGSEGWELVMVLPDNTHIPAANHYHFKRKITAIMQVEDK